MTELSRRTMLAGSAALAGAAGLAGAPANPGSRPKYFHVSQSSINYQAEFRSGKMDIFSFMDTCRALDLDGLDIHVGQLKSQSDRAYLKEVRRGCLNRGLPMASICVTTEFGRSAEAIPQEVRKRGSPWRRECSWGPLSCARSSARPHRPINGRKRFGAESTP